MLLYQRKVVILQSMFLNFKKKHIIKGKIARIERKQGKVTCKSNPSKDPT